MQKENCEKFIKDNCFHVKECYITQVPVKEG